MINSNETTIAFDPAKRKKILLIALGITVFSSIFIWNILTSSPIKIIFLAVFVLLLVIGIVMAVKGIALINSKDQVGLILDSSGVLFKGTPNAKKAGKINWTDISAIEQFEAHGTHQLLLRLKNPSKYIHEVSKIEVANHGVFINATELKISHEELVQLANEYLNKYGA